MTHPNDMTVWPEIGCQRGHDEHFRMTVPVHLAANDSYLDYPRVPLRFRDDFEMEVWRWRAYQEDGPYCPGHDVVSEVIDTLGVWEQCETTVMTLVFEAIGAGGLFIDFGCQVGWYSVLARRMGLDVWAIDADPECSQLTYDNLDHVGGAGAYAVNTLRVGADTRPVQTDDKWVDRNQIGPIVVKIDVEGAEEHAVNMLANWIDDVQYALIEISPVFNDSYPALVQRMLDWGFDVYELPPRDDHPPVIDKLSDLLPYRLSAEEALHQAATIHQTNWLFARGGV